MSRRLALGAVAAMAVGASLAFAQDGAAPGPPAPWTTRPEVPGAARALVPFGIETTPAGARAWALGRDGDETVVLQRGPAGGWTASPLAVGGQPVVGQPVGGDGAPEHAGEISADGHGAVLLADKDHPELDAKLLTRAPGAAFVAAPDPAAGVLQTDEQLVGGATTGTARTLLAVTGGEGASTFVAPTTSEGIASAVLRLGGDGVWHREAIDAPALTDTFHPVGLAAASGAQAWMAGTSGGKVVILRRDPGAAALPARWVVATMSDTLVGGGALPSAVAKVDIAAPPADPLTATTDGVWLDLRVTPADGTTNPDPIDVTEHLKVTMAPPPGSPPPPSTTDPGSTSVPSSTDPGSTSVPSNTDPGSTSVPSGTDPGQTTPPPDEPQLVVDGRWCDLPAPVGDTTQTPLCDHPLGFAFAHGERGYRSVATPVTPTAPFGTREISAPVDDGTGATARARDAERQGGYAALDGDAFVLRDGIGEDGSSTTQAIAFAADGTGFTGGTLAFGAVTHAAYDPPAEDDVSAVTDSLTTAVAAPNGDGRIVAMGRRFTAYYYAPGSGWTYANTGASYARSHDRSSMPRAVAWPRPNLMIVGGVAGLLSTIHADPAPAQNGIVFDDQVGPQNIVNDDALPVQATILTIACTPTDPLDCVAAGRDGLIARGNGESWRLEALPSSAGDHPDITGAAFDGRVPLLATTAGLYRGQTGGDDYARDEDLRTRMSAAGLPAAVRTVATTDGGGVVVDGRFARDDATADWRPTSAPLDLNPYALAAFRDDSGAVRAIVSATPDPTPLSEQVQPDDNDRNPPTTDQRRPLHGSPPLAPVPVDPVTLRETRDGWVDLDRSSFQRSGGRDLPDTTPGTNAIISDASGNGVLLGGVADPSTSSGQIFIGPSGEETDDTPPPTLASTASVRRLDHGAVVTEQQAGVHHDAAESPAPSGFVRLAIGGHPTCLDRCAGAAGQGYAPDTHLENAIARVKQMSAAGVGPAALVLGGGRASLGGEPLDLGGARRYRELVQGAGVPTYVVPGPGDAGGDGASAFAKAFATAPAPQGTGDAPPGVGLDTVLQPDRADPASARGTFAFDVHAQAGDVRVIAIDNASGELAGGIGGDQATWIRGAIDTARSLGHPSIVVGSAPLDTSQGAAPARDASDEIALLAGHASAYVSTAGVDDPNREDFGGAMAQSVVVGPGGSAPLTLLQSSTLGYAPSQAFFSGRIDEDMLLRQTSAALMLLDVDVGHFDPGTGVAPVSPLAEPLMTDLSLSQTPRQIGLGFAQPMYISGHDPSPRRFLASPAAGTPPQPSSAGTLDTLLGSSFGLCRFFGTACSTNVPTDVTYTSSNPAVARFVAVQSSGRGRAQVVLDADGHVVDDPRGFLCPVGLGDATLTATGLGQRVSVPISVVEAPEIDNGKYKSDPIPPGTCAFPVFHKVDDAAKAAPAPVPPAPVIKPAPVVKPAPHHHHHVVQHHAPVPAPAPPPVTATALPAPVQPPAVDQAQPPVAPAAKPPAPAAPPAPPQGLQVQQAQAPQVSPFQAVQHQEERREEYAYESDSAAVAYAHPPSPVPWEVAGGLAALTLIMAGGGLAGRARARRRAVVAPARAAAGRR